MSFEAMALAVKQNLPARDKIVLLMLANRVNSDTGRCTPRIKLLASDCGMSESSCKAALKRLADLGLIEIKSRYEEGVQKPNQYYLNLDGVGRDLTHGGSDTDPGVGQDLATESGSSEPGSEPTRQQQAARVPYEQIFDAYAQALPSLPQLKLKDSARRTLIKQRWHSDPRFQKLKFWQDYFEYVSKSYFLMNECKAIGFDWLLTSRNFKKVLEGNYHGAK